jgi:hypothetical protein
VFRQKSRGKLLWDKNFRGVSIILEILTREEMANYFKGG